MSTEGTVDDFDGAEGRGRWRSAGRTPARSARTARCRQYGLDIDEDFELVYAGYGPSAEALQNGQVAGVSIPAGVPVGAITS
jgi:TRAP-type uncharacterized transport system substrate-binding protein